MSSIFFLFYKSVSQFFMPLGVALLIFLLSCWFVYRRSKKPAFVLLLFSISWLWLWSTPAWSDLIRGSLESKFSYRPATEYPVADAIVVLGGGVRGYAGPHLPVIDLNRAADRELFASQLFRAGKSKVVILSGGADPLLRTGASAMGMKTFLISLGVPASYIRLDANSRNTIENLQEVTRMVKLFKGKTILLVTSALHMQRACWLFSRSGLIIIPAPADFEVVKAPFSVYRLLPDAEALENSTRAAREIIGLIYYQLTFH
ncbi:MAG: YdcF family protein [Bacteroidota bacterium]